MKKSWNRDWEGPNTGPSVLYGVDVSPSWDIRMFSSEEAPLSHGVQCFYWGFSM